MRVHNPIPAWLHRTGVPWRQPLRDLVQRYGTTPSPSGLWDEVYMSITPPPLRGMLTDLHFNHGTEYSPFLPQLEYWTEIWVEDSPEANYRLAYKQVIDELGFEPDKNLLSVGMVEWRSGAGSVRLYKHEPRPAQDATNKYIQREPRLSTACALKINSGWRLPLSQQEDDWLKTFQPLGNCVHSGQIRSVLYSGGQALEFLREHPGDIAIVRGRYGLSMDKNALIFFDGDLFIVPLAKVLGFEIDRLRSYGRNPNGGESKLMAICETGYEAMPKKRLRIIDCYVGMDSLNEIGADLAKRTNKPIIQNEESFTD